MCDLSQTWPQQTRGYASITHTNNVPPSQKNLLQMMLQITQKSSLLEPKLSIGSTQGQPNFLEPRHPHTIQEEEPCTG